MSYVWQLPDTTEDALVAFLVGIGAGTSADVVPARRSNTKTAPLTIVECGKWDAVEGMQFSGNAEVKATIRVVQMAPADAGEDSDTIRANARARIEAAFGAFYSGDFETVRAAINQAAVDASIQWTLLGYQVTGGGRNYEGDTWTDELELTLLCCGTTI